MKCPNCGKTVLLKKQQIQNIMMVNIMILVMALVQNVVRLGDGVKYLSIQEMKIFKKCYLFQIKARKRLFILSECKL